MTEEFDDPELERLLGRMSGAYPDANVAYETVRGRVRQVKRRRTFVASTAACAVLFGVAVVAAQGGGSTDQLSPAEERSETTVAVSDSSAPDTTDTTDMAGAPGDTMVTVDSTPDTSVPDSMGTETSVDNMNGGPANTTSGHGGQGSGGQGSGTSSPNSGPGSTNGGPSTSDHTGSSGPSTSATLPQGEHTWTSQGGSITVRNENGVLTLIAVDPNTAGGFHEATGGRDVQKDRIRIEFTGAGGTWRVEVRADNGKAVAQISHHG
ncbi:MAG: hypothetical protein RJA49_1486 [Actinomycetota bacterium]